MLNIFKSKRRKEQERETAIRNTLLKFKRQAGQLRKDERDYMEKAVRAKNAGDSDNLKRLCALVAQTIMFRKKVESQLLYFETILQTRNQARLISEFAKGINAMSNSVNDMTKELDKSDFIGNMDRMLQQTGDMEDKMNQMVDRIAEAGDMMTEEAGANGILTSDIEKAVSEMAGASPAEMGASIDARLKAIENELTAKES